MTGAPEGCVRLFLAGDVMLGRGVDQILRHPGDPQLHEGLMSSAVDYVRLAEHRYGPILRPVDAEYVWGDLLAEIRRRDCDLRIVNLETAVTTAEEAAPKGINYRMNPANVDVLTAAGIDACILANNHVLDWGADGLIETLETLKGAGLATAGAGRTAEEAAAAAALEIPGKGRVLILAFGAESSGVPRRWAANGHRPGVNLLPRDPKAAAAEARRRLEPLRRPGDLALVSIHWGANWGFRIPAYKREMAAALIEEADADLVFGHSSHHPRAVETHGGKLVLYGCGDLINDYEGIRGFEEFRGDLALAYFADVEVATGRLAGLEMTPYRRRGFRLETAAEDEIAWLEDAVRHTDPALALRLTRTPGGALHAEL